MTCGDLSFERLTTDLGGWANDVIFPCQTLDSFFNPLRESAATKFPFSLTNALDHLVSYSGAQDGQSIMLPDTLGPFTLHWAGVAVLIAVVSMLFKALITWLAVDTVISRLMGRISIK